MFNSTNTIKYFITITKNCIITPHIAWAPKESRQRIMDCAEENLRAWLAGSPVNVVNG